MSKKDHRETKVSRCHICLVEHEGCDGDIVINCPECHRLNRDGWKETIQNNYDKEERCSCSIDMIKHCIKIRLYNLEYCIWMMRCMSLE